MSQTTFGAASVTTEEVDNSMPVIGQPTGIPACLIGTTQNGPAFVPTVAADYPGWKSVYGPSDGAKFTPLAANEWLRNQGSLVTMRVLGVGDGKQRTGDGATAGSVNNAGFTVGEKEPQSLNSGFLGPNANANSGGPLGRMYFLGALMSESLGSDVFSSTGVQKTAAAVPILRALVMAPSGVIVRLHSYAEGAAGPPASTLIASDTTASGTMYGSVTLMDNGTQKQEIELFLNGHKGLNPSYPNYIVASLDVTANNYIANVLNTDPLKLESAGHYLYAHWDIHPSVAVVTGSGVIYPVSGAAGSLTAHAGAESAAFITTGSLPRATSNSYVPDYESFTDRFSSAVSPWIVSQKFGGAPENLFRFHAIDAGAGQSTAYKVAIENLTPSSDPQYQYGTFDVVVRDWNDTDMNPTVLERFAAVTLDPGADNYISRVIGDLNTYFDFDRVAAEQRIVVEGSYPWVSAYVRVEVSQNVDSAQVDPIALPMGHRGAQHLVTSGSAPLTSVTSTQFAGATLIHNTITPPVPFRESITAGSGVKAIAESRYYWGAHFEHVESLLTPNASFWKDDSLKAFAQYYPTFASLTQKASVGDNAGAADTAQNGVIDSDRFCNNAFSLENVQIVTGSNGLADPSKWSQAAYVRAGGVGVSDVNKTRQLSVNDLISSNRRFAKFTTFLQGGFDGVNIFDHDEAGITNAAVAADMADSNRGRTSGASVSAYSVALEIASGIENMDVQLIAVPGIREPVITDGCIETVNTRFDAMTVIDIQQVDNDGNPVTSNDQIPSVALTAQLFEQRNVNSNFAATYFPDQVMVDPDLGINVIVPPSVPMMGVIALNDAVGQPWTAPAGTVRGAMSTVLESTLKLSSDDMDTLAEVGINPIVAFPGNATVGSNPKGGVLAWGQKTLQKANTSLNRVNVRRLLISLRRSVRDIAYTFQFEPDLQSTMSAFSKAIDPILKRAQTLKGLTKYKIQIDTSTTTLADIQNKILRGTIYIKPTSTIENVSLAFKINNATVTFG